MPTTSVQSDDAQNIPENQTYQIFHVRVRIDVLPRGKPFVQFWVRQWLTDGRTDFEGPLCPILLELCSPTTRCRIQFHGKTLVKHDPARYNSILPYKV